MYLLVQDQEYWYIVTIVKSFDYFINHHYL